MASNSNISEPQEVETAREIFDRLFQPDSEDVEWVKAHINSYIEACKGYLDQKPPSYRQALHEAVQASDAACAEGLEDTEYRINFYMAHCYLGLGLWEEAYKFYMESRVDKHDLQTLKRLQRMSKQKMEEDKGLEIRRVKSSENLRNAFRNGKPS